MQVNGFLKRRAALTSLSFAGWEIVSSRRKWIFKPCTKPHRPGLFRPQSSAKYASSANTCVSATPRSRKALASSIR